MGIDTNRFEVKKGVGYEISNHKANLGKDFSKSEKDSDIIKSGDGTVPYPSLKYPEHWEKKH